MLFHRYMVKLDFHRVGEREMKKITILLLCFTLSFIIIQCASTGTKGFSAFGRKEIIEASFDDVFRAAQEYFSTNGFPVIKADKETGDIETEYKLGAGIAGQRQWREAQDLSGSGFTGEKRAKFKARVTVVDSTQTELILELWSELRERSGTWQVIEGDSRSARFTYDRYFASIAGIAKGGRTN